MRPLTAEDAKVLLQIRVPLELRNRLAEEADRQGTSVTQLVLDCLNRTYVRS